MQQVPAARAAPSSVGAQTRERAARLRLQNGQTPNLAGPSGNPRWPHRSFVCDIGEIRFPLGLALRDEVIDEDERRVLGHIAAQAVTGHAPPDVQGRIGDVHEKYDIGRAKRRPGSLTPLLLQP
jgi:hypothetical protein